MGIPKEPGGQNVSQKIAAPNQMQPLFGYILTSNGPGCQKTIVLTDSSAEIYPALNKGLATVRSLVN